MICVIGTFLTVSRIYWALARDRATPFHSVFSKVDERLSCPIPATLLAAVLVTGFGAISLGSSTAFSDLVGSFIILTTASYFLAIFPHIITGRKNVTPGPFWLGKFGYVINIISVVLIVFFDIMFCFRTYNALSVSQLLLTESYSIWHACDGRYQSNELELCYSCRDSLLNLTLVVGLRHQTLSWPKDIENVLAECTMIVSSRSVSHRYLAIACF